MNKKKTSDNAVRNLSVILEGYDTTKAKDVLLVDVLAFLQKMGKYYAITHNKDYTPEGELKRVHHHIVLIVHDKIRKSTLINKISKALDISPQVITIEPIIDLNSSIRYLLHLDNPEKQLYPPFEIETNDRYGLELSLAYMPNSLTPDTMLAIVYTAKANKFQILKAIGMDNYVKYEKVIRVCVEEYYYQSNKELSPSKK